MSTPSIPKRGKILPPQSLSSSKELHEIKVKDIVRNRAVGDDDKSVVEVVSNRSDPTVWVKETKGKNKDSLVANDKKSQFYVSSYMVEKIFDNISA